MAEKQYKEISPDLAQTFVRLFVNYYPDYSYINGFINLLKKHGYDTEPFYWMDQEAEVKPSDLEEILSSKPFFMDKAVIREIVKEFEKKSRMVLT